MAVLSKPAKPTTASSAALANTQKAERAEALAKMRVGMEEMTSKIRDTLGEGSRPEDAIIEPPEEWTAAWLAKRKQRWVNEWDQVYFDPATETMLPNLRGQAAPGFAFDAMSRHFTPDISREAFDNLEKGMTSAKAIYEQKRQEAERTMDPEWLNRRIQRSRQQLGDLRSDRETDQVELEHMEDDCGANETSSPITESQIGTTDTMASATTISDIDSIVQKAETLRQLMAGRESHVEPS